MPCVFNLKALNFVLTSKRVGWMSILHTHSHIRCACVDALDGAPVRDIEAEGEGQACYEVRSAIQKIPGPQKESPL